jgi:hypothetical protein
MPTPNAIVLGLHFSRVQGVPFLAEEGIKILGVGGPLQLRPRRNPSPWPVPQTWLQFPEGGNCDGLSRPDSHPDC